VNGAHFRHQRRPREHDPVTHRLPSGPFRAPHRGAPTKILTRSNRRGLAGGSRSLSPFAIALYRNTDLDALNPAIQAWETSEADEGNLVFMTWNWSAGYSTDGGVTFHEVDPRKVFPSADGGFYCDQVVHYVPKINRFVWIIQYSADSNNQNRYRIAVASPQQIVNSKGTSWNWDLISTVDDLKGVWLDYPDVEISANYLW
jgi:hypothetical protein